QTTPIHDHLTWALIGIYDGEEREALFRRTNDGSNPKIAKIEKVSEKINTKGHVTVLGPWHPQSRQYFRKTNNKHSRLWPRHWPCGTTQLRPCYRRDRQVRLGILQRSSRHRMILEVLHGRQLLQTNTSFRLSLIT